MNKDFFGRFDRYMAEEFIKALMAFSSWNNHFKARYYFTAILWKLTLATFGTVIALIIFFGIVSYSFDMPSLWHNTFFICLLPTVLAIVFYFRYNRSSKVLDKFSQVRSDPSYEKALTVYEKYIPERYRFYPVLEHMYFLLSNDSCNSSDELFQLVEKYMASSSEKVYTSDLSSVTVPTEEEIVDITFLHKIISFDENEL